MRVNLDDGKHKSLAELEAEDVVRACEQNYLDFWRYVGKSPNASFSEDRGITRCISGVPQEVMNVVIRCTLDSGAIDSRIDEAIEDFRARRIPLIWHTGLLTRPRDIGRHLEARGFPHDYDLAAMAVDLDDMSNMPDVPREVSSRSVNDDSECRDWVACLTESWNSPKEALPWFLGNPCFNSVAGLGKVEGISRRMYLGFLREKPVGALMLVWSRSIAGLQAVGTIPSATRRGVGAAVVRAALSDARAMGFRFVVVLSTVEGRKLYLKSGFREYGKLPEHLLDFRTV
jgi:GNAT superfamily N-acetyltransferase